MKLQALDIAIIMVYMASVIVIGLVLQKKARQNNKEYLLGGNTLPWYLLGLSNASGMFDISGTMWLVTLTFVYGMKSVWIPWLWPVFNQIFLMMYLSVWLRRSGVSTGAEWMTTRFGNGRDATLSHSVVVAFALIASLGFLAYGFIGLGKFVEIFIPWEAVAPYVPFTVAPAYVGHFYGILLTIIAGFYAILGGMSSIVWADVIQYVIMVVVSVIIAVLAMNALDTHQLKVPEGWYSPFFGWGELNLDWSGIIDEVNQKIKDDSYSPFGIFFSLMLFKGILASLAGPTPNYDMQKILSTKSPKEAALMSGFVSVVLMPIRYLMIIGFAVLALLFYDQLNLRTGNGIDFEKILPAAISSFVPLGLTGFLLAGLLGAFKGSFAGTLNAAQAYIVNDLYLKYFNPTASNGQISRMNYLTGVVVIVVSIVLGLFAKDVNSILQWIVSALYGSYIAANVLKWHWWRFNGYGFFWGMVAGMVPALIFPYIFDSLDLYYFPLLFAISLVGCIAGTLLTPATDTKTLMAFYKTVRPWGFWKPIHDLVVAEDPDFVENKHFGRDMFNVALGILGQVCLMILPMYIVLKQQTPVIISSAILLVAGIILKKTWWNPLQEEDRQFRKVQQTSKVNAL